MWDNTPPDQARLMSLWLYAYSSISVEKIHFKSTFESVPRRFLLHLHFWQMMSLLKTMANDFACSTSAHFLKQAMAV